MNSLPGLWIWRNIRMALPDDWEMLQFSKNPENGMCAFGDRYQIRLEVTWKKTEREPDLERTLSDLFSKLQNEMKMEPIRKTRIGRWQGIEGLAGGVFTSRFFVFLPGESCLLEAVFIWPEEKDSEVERTFLESVREQAVVRSSFHRWKAFGLDLLASRDLPLTACRSEPGLAEMTFMQGAPNGREERFERLGMVPHWLRVPVPDWLSRKIPKDCREHQAAREEIRGHCVHTLSAREPQKGLGRIRSKENPVLASGWICPQDGRLYFSYFRGGVLPPLSHPPKDLRLFCCPKLGSLE